MKPITIDPDAYCREHGCPRGTCDESHPTSTVTAEIPPNAEQFACLTNVELARAQCALYERAP